jgi:hypothetical protein
MSNDFIALDAELVELLQHSVSAHIIDRALQHGAARLRDRRLIGPVHIPAEFG